MTDLPDRNGRQKAGVAPPYHILFGYGGFPPQNSRFSVKLLCLI